jgi:hypothetical protein
MEEAFELESRSFLPAAGLKFRPIQEHRAGSLLILPSRSQGGLCLGVKVEGLESADPARAHAHGVMVLYGSPWPDRHGAAGDLLPVDEARGAAFETAVLGGHFDNRVEFPVDAATATEPAGGWAAHRGALALGGSGPRLVAGLDTDSGRWGGAVDPATWRIDRTAQEEEQHAWVQEWTWVLRFGGDSEARIDVTTGRNGAVVARDRPG